MTVAILIVATLIGTATALINSSPAYSLVLVWAFYGNYSRHTSAFEWNFQYPSIILATQVLMAVLALVSVGAAVRWLRQAFSQRLPVGGEIEGYPRGFHV